METHKHVGKQKDQSIQTHGNVSEKHDFHISTHFCETSFTNKPGFPPKALMWIAHS